MLSKIFIRIIINQLSRFFNQFFHHNYFSIKSSLLMCNFQWLSRTTHTQQKADCKALYLDFSCRNFSFLTHNSVFMFVFCDYKVQIVAKLTLWTIKISKTICCNHFTTVMTFFLEKLTPSALVVFWHTLMVAVTKPYLNKT